MPLSQIHYDFACRVPPSAESYWAVSVTCLSNTSLMEGNRCCLVTCPVIAMAMQNETLEMTDISNGQDLEGKTGNTVLLHGNTHMS